MRGNTPDRNTVDIVIKTLQSLHSRIGLKHISRRVIENCILSIVVVAFGVTLFLVKEQRINLKPSYR